MLTIAIAAFRADGARDIALTATIRVNNEPSIRLFESAGFRRVASADEIARFELSPEPA